MPLSSRSELHTPEATILVGSCSSRCNACGREVLPSAESHIDVSGYAARPGGGCGVTFTHVKPTYIGGLAEEATRALRPDLTFIPAMQGILR